MTLSDEDRSRRDQTWATRDLFGERDCSGNSASGSGLFLWRLLLAPGCG